MKSDSHTDWPGDLKGDVSEQAIGDLFDYLYKGLLAYFTGYGKLAPEDIKDITQESTLKIPAKLDSFRGESKFTTWAMKIAVTTALSSLRRKRWKNVSLDAMIADFEIDRMISLQDGGQPSPEKAATRMELIAELNQIIHNALTDRQRTVLIAMLNGMPLQEIAFRMKSNSNAIYKVGHDARLKIKAKLQDAGWSKDNILSIFDN